MPATFFYQYSYLLGGTLPTATTPLFYFFDEGYTLTDDQDGNDTDDQTAIGQTLSISTDPGDPQTLVGYTSFGDPVLMTTGNYYVVSNDPNLDGLPSGFTTTGPAYMYCFGAGTGIATPEGERAVERLEIGDLVRTADGRVVPVKWIGRQTISKRFYGERARLVRIAAGVLGNHSDLFVTADHGMIVAGHVVQASALIDGQGIAWVPLSETPDQFTVYHVETEAHDVILANGAASETFLDTAARGAFENAAEYEALYGVAPLRPELPLPRITAARHLPEQVRRLVGVRLRAGK